MTGYSRHFSKCFLCEGKVLFIGGVMHLILLSGGSGKRLWPLSNDVRSKQFLKLLKDEKGVPISMIQRVFKQLSEAGNWESINIVAGIAQKDSIELQIGTEYNLIVEKERRDTFPAIALACSYLYSELNINKDEVVCVLPVDSYVENEYFSRIHHLEEGIKRGHEYMLLGVKPTFPTEKYGYIVPFEQGLNELSEGAEIAVEALSVKEFVEKPSADIAENIISKGALWNCGVFCFQIKSIMEHLSRNYGIMDFSYESIGRDFTNLNKTSFDYEILENASNVGVVPYSGMWMDLGTWQTVTCEMNNISEGNVIIGETCNNTHIINDIGIPIVAMGIGDSVIVASNDGILVSKKDESYKLKDMVDGIGKRPMYERKRWGKYRVIHEGDNVLTKQLIIFKGKQISYQYHTHREEIWTITNGEGQLLLEGQKSIVKSGDVIKVGKKQKHAIRAITDLEIIEVQIGDQLIEEDIVRIDLDWS